ncbi:MAG: hypothetical protein Ct9H300mP21_06910 [Pseudomonadota bacterium]|nr:MAG: hypothetical protein Ct9H300mP21_06910 [Pseudomonadota bacterium]
MTAQWVDISKEVQDALKTIKRLLHWNQQLFHMECLILKTWKQHSQLKILFDIKGAFPATIAVSGGRIKGRFEQAGASAVCSKQ